MDYVNMQLLGVNIPYVDFKGKISEYIKDEWKILIKMKKKNCMNSEPNEN